jgi:hypothetical protein
MAPSIHGCPLCRTMNSGKHSGLNGQSANKHSLSISIASEGEKIQKRVYIISGKFLTFILKVPTFVRFSDHHFDIIIYTESQKRFRQKLGKVQNQTRFPPTNLLVQMHAAGAPQVSQCHPQDNFGWTKLQAAK